MIVENDDNLVDARDPKVGPPSFPYALIDEPLEKLATGDVAIATNLCRIYAGDITDWDVVLIPA